MSQPISRHDTDIFQICAANLNATEEGQPPLPQMTSPGVVYPGMVPGEPTPGLATPVQYVRGPVEAYYQIDGPLVLLDPYTGK